MRVPTVEIIDSTALPRPGYDAPYERGLVSDYYEVQRGYHVMRRKGTFTAYLMYSVSGHGFFRDRHDRVLCVGRGDFALIEEQTYQEYGIWPGSKRWHAHWVHFEPQSHWSHWLPLGTRTELEGVSYARATSATQQREVSRLFFELQAQRTRPEVWRNALALHLLERILILARPSTTNSKPLDPRVWRVQRAIEARAEDPPSAAELSRIAGLSASRLAYLFKQQVGISILAAINRVRLRHAQQALEEPEASVARAAERSGFQSPYSFSNWFVKQTGQRPGEYRRKWLERKSAIRPDNKPWLLPSTEAVAPRRK